ncbi:hypothetical protein [Evansella clarkii]|uniref:hypothetical protein n=1 Tax=Evansella clarkii TaxID=79879 RepID=UPI000997C925|nr:hypothetical protein [Evansella clarkii]
MKKENVIILISFLLIISLVFNYQYLKTHQDEKRQFDIFSNIFVQQLHQTILHTQTLVNDDAVDEVFVNRLMNLKSDLDTLEVLVDASTYIKDFSGGLSNFSRISHLLTNGHSDYGIRPFHEEHQLTPPEEKFLRELLEIMEETHAQLTVPENPYRFNSELNHYHFNNILSENIFGYSAYNRFNSIIESYASED